MANKVINVEIKPNLTGIRSLNSEISKMKSELDDATDAKQIDKLNKELGNTEKQIKDINKATDKFDLKKKFDDIYKETAPLSSRLGELEDRMYELSFAGKAGTDEFKALQMEAVSMRQTIIGVDKQVDILADNKGFSVFGDGIGQVGASLASLDFETASKQASSLAGAASKISFGSAMTSIKQFGTTIIQLGKAILMNPLFLLAAVVAAIAYGIYKLLDALGVIKVIFEAVGAAIGWVVQQLKNFLDFLGLTNYAEQDAAEKSAKAAEKRASAYEEASKRITQALDTEIKLAQLLGKDTKELEKKKLEALSKNNEFQLTALKERVKTERLKGDMDHEELVALAKQTREKRLEYKKGLNDIIIFNAETAKEKRDAIVRDMKARLSMNADTVKGQIAQLTYERNLALKNERLTQNEVLALKQKFNEDVAKIEADDRAERFATYKAYRDNRTSAERKIQDIELELLEEGIDKELKANNYRFDRLIEDTKRDESINQKERIRLIDLFGQQRLDAEAKIQEEIQAAKTKKEEDDKLKEATTLQGLTDFYLKKDELERSLIKDETERLEAERVAAFEAKIAQLEADGLLTNEIEKRLAQDLADDLIAIDKEAAAKKEEIAKQERITNTANATHKFQVASQALGALGDLASAFAKDDEAGAKKAFKINKAVGISQAVISTGLAITAALTAGGNPVKLATGTQFVEAGIAAATGASSIATIAKTQFQGGGGNAPSGPGGAGGGGAQAQQTPNIEMFGQANNLNSFFQPGGQEQGQTLQAVISLDQLSTSQDKASSIYENSIL